MTEHVLKTNPPYFTAIASGRKTFEVRRNDRGYQLGDTLILVDTSRHECGNPECESYLPDEIIRVLVTYVYSGDPSLRDLGGVVAGYVILGLAK